LPLPTTTLAVVLLAEETGVVFVDAGAVAAGVAVLAAPFIGASMLAISSFRFFPDDPMVNDMIFSLASGCSRESQNTCHAASDRALSQQNRGPRIIRDSTGKQMGKPCIAGQKMPGNPRA